MPAEAARLAVEDLTVRRGGRTVVDGLTFAVARGEAFGLLGPNGAGKTSAFRAITGLAEAERGAIFLDGSRVRTSDGAGRQRLGVVFQEPALDKRLTARENLRLAADLYGLRREDASRKIEARLGEEGLSGRADEPVSRLSGGMRRRVELARAVLHEPDVLVLDEPTTGLDEAAFRRTWDRIDALRRERGMSILVTTHRPEEAERCDRIAIVDEGKLVACDTPDGLRARVRGDLVVIEASDPAGVAAALQTSLSLEPRVLEGSVVLERERAHEIVPRIVSSVSRDALRSISVRRAGLGEVFLELTGHALDGSERRGAA